MIRVPGHARPRPANDVRRTDRLEHFRRALSHVSVNSELVGAPTDVDVQHRNSVRIAQCLVDPRAILVARQSFAEACERHHPGAEACQPLLECSANSRIALASLPADATRAALELVPANEIGATTRAVEIPKARNEDTVGPVADCLAILPTGNHTAGAAPFDV